MEEYYVDPSTGNDTTGDGSSGNPWATIQHAHDTGTFAVNTPVTIYLANTSAEVLASPLNLTKQSETNPLCICGWDNGGSITCIGHRGQTITGVGEIDGNDAVTKIIDNKGAITLRRIKCHSTTSYVLQLGQNCRVLECEIYNGGTYVLYLGSSSIIADSYLHDDAFATYGIYMLGLQVVNCHIDGCDNAIYVRNASVVRNNLITNVKDVGIVTRAPSHISNNTIVASTSADSDVHGIRSAGDGAYRDNVIINNVIAGFNGASAKGIYLISTAVQAVVGNNSFFDCTTEAEFVSTTTYPDFSETITPFEGPAVGNYSIRPTALAYTDSVLTYGDIDNPDILGAIQNYSAPRNVTLSRNIGAAQDYEGDPEVALSLSYNVGAWQNYSTSTASSPCTGGDTGSGESISFFSF